MKALFKFIGIAFTVGISLLYLVSSLTSYISPEHFPLLTILSIGFLITMPVYVITVFIWLLVKRKVGLVLLLLGLVGYKNLHSTIGLNFPAQKLSPKPKNSLRVMSWNINEFVNDQVAADTPGHPRRKIFDYINEVQPDILCIQDLAQNEGAAGYLSNIAEVLKTGNYVMYHFPSFTRFQSGTYKQGYGVAIFSKLPADTGSVSLKQSGNDESVAFIDFTTKGKKIRIFNAHLSSMSLWPSHEGEAGVNYLKGDSTEIKAKTIYTKIVDFGVKHAREAKLIRKAIDTTGTAVIFCGDLNSVPSSFVHQHIKGDLKDVFLEKGFLFGGTYNRLFPKIRIDVMLHSPQLKVVNYYRPALTYSDHCPIIADFSWKE